ncbi:hypothetical protein DsansV1_C06g0062721 [Dioscorea sansibarensis]
MPKQVNLSFGRQFLLVPRGFGELSFLRTACLPKGYLVLSELELVLYQNLGFEYGIIDNGGYTIYGAWMLWSGV